MSEVRQMSYLASWPGCSHDPRLMAKKVMLHEGYVLDSRAHHVWVMVFAPLWLLFYDILSVIAVV